MDRSLSIIFTVYNKERFLKKALDCLYEAVSLLTTPYEVIIVEDCSTDSSYEILKEYAERPHTIVLRNDVNKGHFQTKCRGYLKAKHTWIMTIDGDDYVDKEYIKELVDAVNDDTFLLIARNNKVLSTEITDHTVYWSIHNLPFMIFRRELITKYPDYYSAPLPRSAWDDCIIVTPMYCQVTELVDAGLKNALVHYKNKHRYNVNYSHSTEEITGIAKATIEKGIQLMKHLRDWAVKTGYMDKYYRYLIPVLTQYVGVFSIDVSLLRPFIKEIHPRKDNSIVVIYEHSDNTKEFKDYKQLNTQLTFVMDTYFSRSFTDSLRYLYQNDLIKDRPVLRISGECNYANTFIDEILKKINDKEFTFDCAGYTYNHKGRTYIDYTKPVLYNNKLLKITAKLSSSIALQEAIRLISNIKTVSLNELYDRIVYSKSCLKHSLTYIPKIIATLNKPIEKNIARICKAVKMKDMPIIYIKDESHSDAENFKRLEEFRTVIPKEILPVTLGMLKEVVYTETVDEPWLILTYNMSPKDCIKIVAATWQLIYDEKSFNIVTHMPCLIEKPNCMKLYAPLKNTTNVLSYGGIIKCKRLANNNMDLLNDIYQAI